MPTLTILQPQDHSQFFDLDLIIDGKTVGPLPVMGKRSYEVEAGMHVIRLGNEGKIYKWTGSQELHLYLSEGQELELYPKYNKGNLWKKMAQSAFFMILMSLPIVYLLYHFFPSFMGSIWGSAIIGALAPLVMALDMFSKIRLWTIELEDKSKTGQTVKSVA